MKAGLNEIADVFVVNKADREGADRVKAELELSVHLRPGDGWRAPVLLTQAAVDKGVDAVVAAIAKHRRISARASSMRRARPSAARTSSSRCCPRNSRSAPRARVADGGAPGVLSEVRAGKLNPYSAARRIIEDRKSLLDLLHNGSSKPRTD